MADSDHPAVNPSLPPEGVSISRRGSSANADPASEIARELVALRARIDVLERMVGVVQQPIASVASVTDLPGAAEKPPSAATLSSEPQPALLAMLDQATPTPVLAPAATATVGTPAPSDTSKQRLNIEQLVGTRWYAAAGALALVVGLALFAKLAYDQGWLRVPPGPRCVLVAIAGAMLIAAGEVVRRRFTRVGSIGLYAAGLGALYAAPLAATRLYDLVHPGFAFLLLIAVSSLGVLIAARLRFILVAIISLVGAYMAPILLSTGEPSYVVYPAYMLLLLATGLFISAFLRGNFVHIRTLVWGATFLLGGFWVLADGYQSPINGLSGVLFVTIAWVLVHVELLLAARAMPANPELTLEPPDAAGVIAGPAPRPFWRSLALSVSTSVWASVLVTITLQTSHLLPDWTGVAGFAVGSALAALALAGHLRFMLDAPRSATERLGAVLGVEAAAMAIIAVALGLTGLGEVIAYMVMAAGVLVAANWLRSVPLLVYGCVVAGILSARLVAYDCTTSLHRVPFLVAGLALTTWTGLMLATTAIWAFAAWCVLRLGERPEREDSTQPEGDAVADPRLSPRSTRVAHALFLLAGLVCFMAAVLHPEANAAAIATVWLLLAAALSIGGRALPGWPLAWVALVPLAFTLIPWLVVVVSRGWGAASWGDQAAGPAFLRATFLLASAIIVGGCVLPPRVPKNESPAIRRMIIAWRSLAACIFLGATSAEAALITSRLTTDPTTQAATISIWWALIAVGAVVGGFVRPLPLVRRLGLALLGVAAIKIVVFDLADVSPVARIASFITLGVLMLAVAVIYGRVSRHLEGPEESRSPAASTPPTPAR